MLIRGQTLADICLTSNRVLIFISLLILTESPKHTYEVQDAKHYICVKQ